MPLWDYSWKTSDGVRHEGVMSAESKDAVYKTLNEKGIRPIKVSERMIVKGGIRSLRKRDWTVLAVVLAAAVLVALLFARKTVPVPAVPASSGTGTQSRPRTDTVSSQVVMVDFRRVRPLPRRQIDGFANLDFAKIFTHPSEAFLASFAAPGDLSRLSPLTDAAAADFFDAFEEDIRSETNDTASVVTLKRVVAGMKREAESYLESGKSAEDLAKWLAARQRMEASFRHEMDGKVRGGGLTRDEANVVLRDAGLKELE